MLLDSSNYVMEVLFTFMLKASCLLLCMLGISSFERRRGHALSKSLEIVCLNWARGSLKQCILVTHQGL